MTKSLPNRRTVSSSFHCTVNCGREARQSIGHYKSRPSVTQTTTVSILSKHHSSSFPYSSSFSSSSFSSSFSLSSSLSSTIQYCEMKRASLFVTVLQTRTQQKKKSTESLFSQCQRNNEVRQIQSLSRQVN